jgi:hypothetical protein
MSLKNELKSKKYLPQAKGVRKYNFEYLHCSSILSPATISATEDHSHDLAHKQRDTFKH